MQVGIIDYGAGNLESVRNALYMVDADPIDVSEPEDVLHCDRIVLPGVGAARSAMQKLRDRGLVEALTEAVCVKARPMLGICLGMQMLASKLHEFGETEGLNWIDGEVVDMHDLIPEALTVPHIGWSPTPPESTMDSPMSTLGDEQAYYFCHSYTLRPKDERVIAAKVGYGADLVAAVCKDTVFATQFHPEKSQLAGRKLMQAFLSWAP